MENEIVVLTNKYNKSKNVARKRSEILNTNLRQYNEYKQLMESKEKDLHQNNSQLKIIRKNQVKKIESQCKQIKELEARIENFERDLQQCHQSRRKDKDEIQSLNKRMDTLKDKLKRSKELNKANEQVDRTNEQAIQSLGSPNKRKNQILVLMWYLRQTTKLTLMMLSYFSSTVNKLIKDIINQM